jgi:3-oxoacyl-[acyl-carrier-protein] synthase-3
MNEAIESAVPVATPAASNGSIILSLPKFWHNERRLKVLGMATALPGPPLTTTELLTRIERRFGIDILRRGMVLASRLKIETRHISRDFEKRHEAPRLGHTNAELAAAALRAALDAAQVEANDLSYVIGHTTTPSCLAPPNIAFVVDHVGFDGPYMELRQACTGFANALVVVQGLLSTPGTKAVAIVGSETGSVYFDPARAEVDTAQLVNLVMMGDGAAAIVLGPDDQEPGPYISGNFFGQVGIGRRPGFSLAAGGSDQPYVEGGAIEFDHHYAAVRDNGPELFHHGAAIARALGTGVNDVDHVIPHQANGRMAELLGPFLGTDPSRIFVNADRLGNTGSAAIWLALAELRSRLEPGETALALGAEATKYMFGGFHYVHG